MTTKYQRPEAVYEGNSSLLNRDKYQSDASAQPRVSISSEKIDSDFNYIIDALNGIDDASGTAGTIAARLNQSLNDDGSLKVSASTVLDDWIKHDVTGLNRADGSAVTFNGDATGIYTNNRRVRLIVAGVPLFAHVASCTVSASITTLSFVDITNANGEIETITVTPSEISYSPVFSGDLGNLNSRFSLLKASDVLVENEGAMLILNDTNASGETYALRSNGGAIEIVKNTGTSLSPVWAVCSTINESGFTLNDDSVTTSKLQNSSVTEGKINSGAASNGQLLTADGSGGVSFENISGRTWEKISEVDFDGTFNEIDITPLMSGYTALRATFINATADGNCMIYGRVSNDGGSTFLDNSGDYWRAFHSINSSGTTLNDGLENRDALNLMNNNTDELTESAYGSIIISGLETGFNCICKSQFIMKDALSKLYSVHGAVMVNGTALVNGFKFYNVYLNNFASGGKFILEGIKS